MSEMTLGVVSIAELSEQLLLLGGVMADVVAGVLLGTAINGLDLGV